MLLKILETYLFINYYLDKKKNLTTYKKLIDLLLKIQKIKPKSRIKNIIDKTHVIDKYTNKHLHKESDLFFDWYLPLFINKKKVLNIKRKKKKFYLHFITV